MIIVGKYTNLKEFHKLKDFLEEKIKEEKKLLHFQDYFFSLFDERDFETTDDFDYLENYYKYRVEG